MPTMTSAGVGSGLNLEQIISSTLQAEYQPKAAKLNKTEESLKVQLTGLGGIKSVLAKLQDVMKELGKINLFENRTATTRQPGNAKDEGDLISVSASTTATPGSFNIEVSQLAKGSRAVSSAGSTFTTSGDVVSATGGTLTFTAGTKTFDITVAAGATLEEIRQQVNKSKENFGVSVNIINTGGASQLVVTSNVTGAGNDLAITGSSAEFDKITTTAFGGGAGGLTTSDNAKDAMIKVDGIAITSQSNTFTDAVQGLTIKALRESVSAETAKATVDFDREGVSKQIDAFISAYNNAIDMIDQQSLLPSSGLYRDPTVRALKAQLFDALSTTVADSGKFETIFDVGLALNEDNKLEKKKVVRSLNDALDTNYADVGSLFTNVGGLAETFNKMLETYVGTGGVIKRRQDDVDVGLKDIKTDRENLDYRLEVMEKNLRKKYSSLDVLIAQMNSTNTYLTNQLAALSKK